MRVVSTQGTVFALGLSACERIALNLVEHVGTTRVTHKAGSGCGGGYSGGERCSGGVESEQCRGVCRNGNFTRIRHMRVCMDN